MISMAGIYLFILGTCSTDHHGNQGPPTAASPSSSLRGRRTDMLRLVKIHFLQKKFNVELYIKIEFSSFR